MSKPSIVYESRMVIASGDCITLRREDGSQVVLWTAIGVHADREIWLELRALSTPDTTETKRRKKARGEAPGDQGTA